MKWINSQMVIWLVIQLLMLLFTMSSQEQESLIIFWMTLPFAILNCIAIAIILFGKPKTGSILFFIGSVLFIPIGIIGAIGARKNLNQIKKEKFINTI